MGTETMAVEMMTTGAETSPGSASLASLPGQWSSRSLPDPDPETLSDTPAEPAAAGAASRSGGQPASIQAFFKGRAKSYAKIAEVLFTAVGGALNAAAQHELDGTTAWLPDDDDLETVPPPLGRIAARRLKIGVDPAQLGDIEDIGMAAVGLLAWAAKGVAAVFAARRARNKLEDGRAVYNETGDGQ